MEAHGKVGSPINEEPVSINHSVHGDHPHFGDLLEAWIFMLRFQEVLGMRKCLSLKEFIAELDGSSFDGLLDAHVLMLRALLREFPQKMGQIKNVEKRTEINFPPVNKFTWRELARRYALAMSFLKGELGSLEVCDGIDVLLNLCGYVTPQSGPITGVAGLEADAEFLAAASNRIYSSLYDDGEASEDATVNEGIPGWVQELEPVKSLKTNVGSRIRICIKKSLDKDPPEWARECLVRSISKEVYKANASGPTKKLALEVASTFLSMQQNPSVGRTTRKSFKPMWDIVMKQCRIVLRKSATGKQTRKLRRLLGDKSVFCGSNEEGLLGSPAMVSSLFYLRMIDLRLAAGAYGSHEAFFDDVQEFWTEVQAAFCNNPNLVQLAEESYHAFDSLYLKEVLPLQQKLDNCNEDIDDLDAVANEIPKAPWDKGICKVCGIDEEDNKVLLCDQCDAEYHTYCLSPPLVGVPRGSWHCLNCVADENVVQDAISSEASAALKPKEQNSDFLYPVQYKVADVVDVMREKEYSELTSDERILLLKFFCNEMLDSDLIREHLKKCELSSSQHPIESGPAMHATIESALFKYSLRSEFLGMDYTGKLYWMIDSDAGTWVIVNGVDELYQDSENSKVVENSKLSRIQQLWSIEGSNAYSSWACYQSEVEIKGVVDSLKDDDQVKVQVEKALLRIRSRIDVSPNEFKIEGEEPQPLVLNEGQNFITRTTTILKGKGNYAPSVEAETSEMKMKRIKGKMVVEDTEEVDSNSVQPLIDKMAEHLGQLKINLLDMEAAIPKEALRSSKACIYRRHAWRVFVKRSNTIFEMVQALIVFEDMIKLSYLDCSWRYWSSLPTAAQISTVSALSLRIYSLDAAIKYDNSSSGPSKSVFLREFEYGETSKKRKRGLF
ncbi:hypothetical protein ABFS82_08G013100 [Erythranthe guttata]|nr:PREDICTED: methyl-CpG-binding domain-containing protein 9-like [Erythranthe guttata]XP_012849359.1 PREDICTED: methyl-CpG-binding domain-containing protein 9-like [Erythranthe guttata]XP_012849367.1 PREDICTED: methyl-CpG-binding domain-containing protein 9-like [Erythranthe guttata]|eukprot:XP_012849351.1 PREDICTED: methyl-CpG-binding domain-containing protein 9-like [Erythranthe guttata]